MKKPERNQGKREYPNREKKRSTKRRALRLKTEAKKSKQREGVRKLRSDVALIAVVDPQWWAKKMAIKSNLNPDVLPNETEQVIIGVRRGALGGPNAPVLRISAEDIVGAAEDNRQLGEWCTKLGVLCLSQLLGYNLAYGPDGLGKALAKFAQIDLEALKRAAAEEASTPDQVAGPGPVVATAENSVDNGDALVTTAVEQPIL